jgi:hypothetical protein
MGQLYSLQVDLGSTSHENYMHPALLSLLLDKQGTASLFVNSDEESVFFMVTKNYRGRCWTSGQQSNKESFQTPLLLSVILILISACEDEHKIMVLRWNAKKMKSMTQLRNMCSFGKPTYQ